MFQLTKEQKISNLEERIHLIEEKRKRLEKELLGLQGKIEKLKSVNSEEKQSFQENKEIDPIQFLKQQI